ncbi:MAG TPA: tetratricopeptide repeat protein, partial [Candidatus Omnitrophota bacterium]|nr:tetratricopeptide repeat protein [Candidatus Omnitrophota bacterium]
EVYLNIGTLYYLDKKYDEAERYYKLAVKSQDGLWQPWNNLRVIAYLKKDYPQAENLFKIAADKDASAALPRKLLISLYIKQNRIGEAFDIARGYWEKFPNDEWFGFLLVEFYEFYDQEEKALEVIQRMIKITGKKPKELFKTLS